MQCSNPDCGKDLDQTRDKFCFNCGKAVDFRHGGSGAEEAKGGRTQEPQQQTTEVGMQDKSEGSHDQFLGEQAGDCEKQAGREREGPVQECTDETRMLLRDQQQEPQQQGQHISEKLTEQFCAQERREEQEAGEGGSEGAHMQDPPASEEVKTQVQQEEQQGQHSSEKQTEQCAQGRREEQEAGEGGSEGAHMQDPQASEEDKAQVQQEEQQQQGQHSSEKQTEQCAQEGREEQEAGEGGSEGAHMQDPQASEEDKAQVQQQEQQQQGQHSSEKLTEQCAQEGREEQEAGEGGSEGAHMQDPQASEEDKAQVQQQEQQQQGQHSSEKQTEQCAQEGREEQEAGEGGSEGAHMQDPQASEEVKTQQQQYCTSEQFQGGAEEVNATPIMDQGTHNPNHSGKAAEPLDVSPTKKNDKKKKNKGKEGQTASQKDQSKNDKQAVKTWEVVPDPFRTAKQKKKMNIVFHAILAPHFGYQEDVNRIFMRFGGPFGDWNENLVQLHPVRNLPGGFILIRGELKDVPVGLVQGKVVEYKYGLAKREEGEVKFLYEELLECEPLTNRCLEIPAQARKDGGVWHQYDDTIFPEPTKWQSLRNYMPASSLKSMDLVEGRRIATNAMLPCWEGFCSHGCEMKASDVITQIQSVHHCMTKSRIRPRNGGARNGTPTGYDFKKVLEGYLRPWMMEKEPMTKETDEKSDEKVTLRLASAVAGAQLLVQYQIFPSDDCLANLLRSLAPDCDVMAKKCAAFEGLIKHFPEESWSDLGDSIQRVCRWVVERRNHQWLFAVPLLHFLTGQSAPFDKSGLFLDEPKQKSDEWWGAEGLTTRRIREGSFSMDRCPSSLAKDLSPLFQLDPLFKRTFLLVVPVKAFGIVTTRNIFNMLEVCTTLARVWPEKSWKTEDEWNAVGQCITNLTGRFRKEAGEMAQAMDEKKCEMMKFSASSCFQLLNVLLPRQREKNRAHLFFDLAELLSMCASELCQKGGVGSDFQNDQFEEICRLIQRTVEVFQRWIDGVLDNNLPCYNANSVNSELEIWSRIFSVGFPKGDLENLWQDAFQKKLSDRLSKRKPGDLVELYKTDVSKYHDIIEDLISRTTFTKVEALLQTGQQGVEVFQKLKASQGEHQASKCRELLNMMLEKCWPQPSSGLEPSPFQIFEHVLTGRLWPRFFENSGKGSTCLELFGQEGQGKIVQAISTVEAIFAELKRSSIKVGALGLIRDHLQSFLELCRTLKSQGMDEVTRNRLRELEAFEDERKRLVAFLPNCSMMKQVDVVALRQQTCVDVSHRQIDEVALSVPPARPGDSSAPCVVFFGLSDEVKSMIHAFQNVQGSSLFRKLWEDYCSRTVKQVMPGEPSQGRLSIHDVCEMVWNPASTALADLRTSCLNGSITLKQVDEHFRHCKGDYEHLRKEIAGMIPADDVGKNAHAEKINERVEQIRQYHQLNQYLSAATAVLKFQEAMQLNGDFKVVEDLKNQMTESFKKRSLQSMDEQMMLVGRALQQITAQREECLRAFVRSKELVDWLRTTIQGTQELKVLVDLALISGGETDMEADRITFLHSSCLGFAPLIFDLQHESCGLSELMQLCKPVWEAIEGDPNLPRKLEDTNRHLEWLKAIKESHGSVAMSSLMQAEAVNARGIYEVGFLSQKAGTAGGTGIEPLISVIRLTVPPKEGDTETRTYNLDELKDLQSKLMLIAGKASHGNEEVDSFVAVFEGILRLATLYVELCKVGEVCHLTWKESFHCRPARVGKEPLADQLNRVCDQLEGRLERWMGEVHRKRMEFYHLNHYTTRQLLYLRESLASARNGGPKACEKLPLQVFSLLESVLPNVLPSTLHDVFVSAGILSTSERDPLTSFDAGFSFQNPGSFSSTVGPGRGPPSARPAGGCTVEKFNSLVGKVESFCEDRDIDAEKSAVAAIVACGDVASEADLMLWCYQNGQDENLVAENFSAAKADPRFAGVMASLGELPLPPEEEEGMDLIQEPFDEFPDEPVSEEQIEDVLDQTADGKYLSLDDLGSVLRHLAHYAPKKSTRHFPPYMKAGRPNLILVGKDDIFSAVLGLFMRDGSQSLPTHEEVFICDGGTTAEEIELLWRRALGDKEGRVFCLVNADLVDYSVSQKAVDTLEQLLRLSEYSRNEKFGLAILCSVENEDRAHVVAALDQYRVGTAPPCPGPDKLRGYLATQFRASSSTKGRFLNQTIDWVPAAEVDPEKLSVRVVSSSRSGVGKSLFVQRLSEELENSKKILNNDIAKQRLRNLGADVPPLIAVVPIHERTVNQSAVVGALLQHSIAPNIPLSRIFHIDVSPSVKSGVDSLLFNLLVLGLLSDEQGHVWRRRSCDLYVVEITTAHPSTVTRAPQHTLRPKKAASAPFHQLLPSVVCKTPREVSRDLQAAPSDTGKIYPLFDAGELHNPAVQRAFQYLMLWESGQSLDHLQFVPGQVAGGQTKCLEVLLRHCGVEDPSWAEIRHFVDFLNTQLLACEQSVFCDPVHVGDTLQGFRTFVVRFMILMSVDFATPSLSGACVEAANPADTDDEEGDIAPYQITARRKWEESSHPFIFFNQDHVTMTFVGFHIDRDGNLLNPDTRQIIEQNLMTRQLRTGLHVQRVDMETNYESWSKAQKIEKLCQVMGVEWPIDPDETYELTTDNMKKILAIHMRFRCGIPVVIMGETGCGKTRLIRYMCGLQAGPGGPRNMLLMKVHGGTTCEDIQRKVEQAERMAQANQVFKVDTVLFFDEANTTDALGMIKEVMVDRRINGRRIGVGLHRLQFIAACNPYRKHTDEMIQKLEKAGLGYHVKTEDTEDRLGLIPLRHLVYRVHSLPESMRPLVWDFGQLQPEIEEMYTRQIVSRYILHDKRIPGDQSVVKTVTSVLAASQRFMRKQEDECSFVSLRDVERAMCVMVWFYEHLDVLGPLMDGQRDTAEEEDSEEDSEDDEEDDIVLPRPQTLDGVTRALVLSLGVCYHARLQDREPYRDAVAKKFMHPCRLPGGADEILREITSCQRAVLDELELGPNIARNKALSENVFMMVICIELRIPLFVVGKPGSSKSLAKTVVHDNMQGDAARSPLFKTFKQVHMASYQCSPLSTPEGIVATFRQCRKLQKDKNLDKFVSVVVLDEVGLAEDSPLMPLKTLHPLLEDGVTSSDDVVETDEVPERVAFVGISNWALDPAKMNRGIMLSRGVPDQQELEDSATGICSTVEHVKSLVMALIEPLAAGYKDLYKTQRRNEKLKESKKDEFFGLRDFYSLVKMLYSIAQEARIVPTWPEIEHAIRRNFGGLDEINPVQIFRRHFGEMPNRSITPDSPVNLIRASLERKHCRGGESRYLLILTENYAALPIIQRELLKEEDDAVVIFGSSFPKDQEYTQVCRNINRIKVCMETGRTVILLNLESLYESLYDALNQYYVYLGDQKYVDLGLGSHRVKCRVNDKFRLIVIAERDVVYSKFPIPLINRLEKHYLVTLTSLTPAQSRVVHKLREWVTEFSTVQIPQHEQRSRRKFTAGDAFAGFHDDTVASVVLQVCSELDGDEAEDEAWHEKILEQSQRLLLQCAFPDAVARLQSTQLRADADYLWTAYFTQQQHSSLAAYVREILANGEPTFARKRENGFLVQVTTHSRLLSDNDLRDIVEASLLQPSNVCRVSLQQFHTEQQFCHRVRDFFAKLGGREGLLIVQSDSGDVNANLIASARHLLTSEQRSAGAEDQQQEFRASPVHIVMVVQLPRLSGGCTNFVGFQGGRWLSVHIDELRPPTQQIPSIEFLVDRPISALFDTAPRPPDEVAMEIEQEIDSAAEGGTDEGGEVEETAAAAAAAGTDEEEEMEVEIPARSVEDKVDVVSLLRSCVQAAVARIDDNSSDSRATRRIELMLNLLPEEVSKETDISFANLLSRHVHQLLLEKDQRLQDQAADWLRDEARSCTGLQERGTFRKALWGRVYAAVTPILAEVIAFIDRDANLELIGDQDWLSRMWLVFFQSPELMRLCYDDFLTLPSGVIRERVPLLTSGRERHVFQNQFPFSSIVKQEIDSLWKGANSVAEKSGESLAVCLRDHIVYSNLAPVMKCLQEDDYEESAAERYLNDFVHMVHKPRVPDEIELIRRAIVCAAREQQRNWSPEEPFSLDVAQIHVAHAHTQRRLNLLSQLVEAQPEIVPRLLEAIPKEQDEMVADAVALQLCLVNLEPSQAELRDLGQRLLWCNKVLSVRTAADTTLAQARHDDADYGPSALTVIRECRPMWQRLSAVRLFVENIFPSGSGTHPDDIDNVFKLWRALGDETDFTRPKTMNVIVRFLRECSETLGQRLHRFVTADCPVCHGKTKDPVELPCTHVTCLGCVTTWFARNRCCPYCMEAVPDDFTPAPSPELKKDMAEHADFRCRCNLFFMELVTLFCFGDSRDPVHEDVFAMLMSYVICEDNRTQDFTPFADHGIDPTPVVRSFLLQQLLRSSDKQVGHHMTQYLERAWGLRQEAEHVMQVCQLFVQCKEDALVRDYSKIADNTLLLVKVAQEKCKEAGAALAAHASRGPPQLDLRTLEGVAKARFVLIHVAEFMFRGCEDGDATWEKAEMRIELGILFEEARRMCDNCSSPVPRVYLLKQLARRFGLGSIQRLAQVRNLAWILPPKDRTRQPDDVAVDRFVVYEERYRDIREAITRLTLSANPKELAVALEGSGNALLRDVMLLLAEYREVTMCDALNSPDRQLSPQAHQCLGEFFQTSALMSDKIRPFAAELLSNTHGAGFQALRVTPDQLPTDRMLAEVVIHTAAVLQCMYRGSLVEPLRMLMEQPAGMNGAYFPAMPDDNLQEAMAGMTESGTWYQCPNGHPYYIGDCGRPTETKLCRECNVPIGGANHQLVVGNVEAQRVDRTSTGHVLGNPAARSKVCAPERTLSPVVVSVIRLLMHSAMVLGATKHPQDVTRLIQPAVDPGNLSPFLWQHLRCDVECLARSLGRSLEDSVLTVHMILSRLAHYAAGGPVSANITLTSKDGRRQWEAAFNATFVSPLISELETRIQECNERIVTDSRLGNDPLMRQLYEIDVAPEALPEHVPPTQPSLWRYRVQVTIEHLKTTFQEEVASADNTKYPVVADFLAQEHQLRALRFLPDIVKLQRLLKEKFHRRLDRKEAQSLRVKDFLEKHCRGPLKREFKTLIASFRSAWNLVRAELANLGRLRVPTDLCEMTFDNNSSLAMLLPTPVGLGICSTGLVYHLTELHNWFNRLYQNRIGAQARDLPHIPVGDVTMAHLVAFHPERDLVPMMLAHCDYSLEVGKGTSVHYNWLALERHLIDRFVKRRPLVDFKDDRFAFSRDTGDETLLASLREKLPQVPISSAVCSQILSEFRSNLSDVCDALANVEIAFGFLSSAGGNPDRLVSEYLSRVLRMPGDAGLRSPKARQTCRLRHVVALWKLLTQERAQLLLQRRQDPFEKTPNWCKEQMSRQQKFNCSRQLRKIDVERFVSELLEVILINLKSETKGAEDMSLRDYLEWQLDNKKCDQIVGLDQLPEDLLVKHAVDVWSVAAEELRDRRNPATA